MTWYLVCYLGMGNSISVERRFNSKDEAIKYMAEVERQAKSTHSVYFILEASA